MHYARTVLLASTLLTAAAVSAHAEVKVVTSIKPIHSLVSAVMNGVGEPGLIVDGAGSPHNYALKPSQAQMLESADIVFWVGHVLEAFLEKPLETIAANAKSIELMDAHDLVKLGFREGGAFEGHGHDGEDDHDDHDDHAEAEHDHDHEETAEAHDDEHGHEEKAEAHADEHDHDHDTAAHDGHHDDHAHGEYDAHIWLDPVNAKAIVHEVQEALASADPANAAIYEANAEAVSARLDILITEVTAKLEPVKDKGFIVFHDAYHYFENRFGVTASGSITVSPEVMPGAERITEIQARVQELGAACVFAEPQFEPKLVSTVIEGTAAKSGIVDPLGTGLANGPDLYFEVIGNMADSIKTCLSEAS